MPAPLPPNEQERLENLYAYQILDTLPEQVWDDVTKLAAQILDVPIAAVSFVDAERQWFKSIVGLDVQETSRNVAFCAHTILGHDPLIVEDATRDVRFQDNPLVTGEPHIRFYAGIPLITEENQALGAFCVIDREPRQLSLQQQESLTILSRQIGQLLKMRWQSRQLRQALSIAERSAEKQKSVLSNISHEMRTPLNAILGYTHLLSETLPEGQQKQYLQTIQASSDLLLKMINNILDFAKIESGKVSLQYHLLQLHLLGENLQDMLSLDAKQKQLELVVDTDPRLPEYLYGDALKIQQVLLNLMNNAVKFTTQGTVKLKISRIEGDRQDLCYCRFEVSDTGPGISSQDQITLFEPFQQLEVPTSVHQKGTGLGLAICRELVNLMGGEIQVRSQLGEGSVFSFCLPLAFESPAVSSDLKPLHLKVLVVDDEEENLTVLDHYLKDWACEVKLAQTPTEAKTAFFSAEKSARPFDVLLMDWQMPGQDGLDLIKELKAGFERTAFQSFLMTAFSTEALQTSHLLGVVDGVLSKPINQALLYQKLSRGLNAKNSVKESLVFHHQRVLVVDDEPLNRQLMETLLQKHGLEVMCVSTGEEALKMLQEPDADVHLIFMDFQMPGMGGVEATRQMKATVPFAHIPVVGLSANMLDEARAAFLSVGGNAFLGKPIQIDALQRVLVEFLSPQSIAEPVRSAQSSSSRPEEMISDEESHKVKLLSGLRVMDFEAASERLLGQTELLWQLLEQFHAKIKAQRTQWFALLEKPSVELLNTLHTLKGNAGNLSLIPLYEATRDLEQVLKLSNAEHENLHTAEAERFKSVLIETQEALHDVFQASNLSPRDATVQPKGMTRDGVKKMLLQLDDLLAHYDVDALEALNALIPQVENADQSELEALKDSIVLFDYPAARTQLAAMLLRLDEG